jgi:DNA-binding NarL/FixJ family response regulator
MSSILLIVLDATARAEISRLADSDATMAVSDAVDSLAAARTALARRLPDLIVADVRLPDGPLVNLLDELRPRRSHVLALTPSLRDPHLMHTLRHGADGYALSGHVGPDLLLRMQRMLAGESSMDARVAQLLTMQLRTGAHPLLEPELKLLHAIGAGASMAEVARSTQMTPQQIGLTLRAIYRKLHLDLRPRPAASGPD